MNIIGKILVILNFLFALIVGAFLAVDFATRQNWKTQIDEYQKELKVARANNQALSITMESVAAQVQAARADLDAKKLELAREQANFASKEVDLANQIKEADQRATLADVNFQKALAAQERMRKEVDGLKAVVEDREGRLVKLHKQYTESQNQVLALDRDFKFSQERNQILIQRVQELEKVNAEMQTGGTGKGDSPAGKGGDNPPPRFVKGVVERVDKDLVRVSLGTDHGIRVGNTLEVYRSNPTGYVGTLRIVDAYHHTAVARFTPSPGSGQTVREGDTVASSLSPR